MWTSTAAAPERLINPNAVFAIRLQQKQPHTQVLTAIAALDSVYTIDEVRKDEMLSIFNGVRDITMLSVTVRLCLAVLCGGMIGLERAFKRRPAGFRTHILICLGASLTTMTSQYLYLNMHYFTDMARLGAQVVAGIGFIGAGTIIVTRRQRVKGLTTAAGLWTSAIVGLALGGGFYEGGIAVSVLVLLAELVFSRLEYRILDNVPEINLYMEYSDKDCLENVLQLPLL